MISVQNLTFAYPQTKEPTIKGISFEIGKGEIFGFLGPSGAGKSTTQKILIGILKRYGGSASVLGKQIKTIRTDFYEHIGVVFEYPNLYTKFSARENLDYFRSLYSVSTEEPDFLLKMVGLEQDASTRVSGFSKGMKMRLNFCRGLLNLPKVLFLDEPTSGLDPVNAKKVKDIILERRAQGTTIFLTTHNMHDAQDLCDRVAFIVDGQLRLVDSPRELMVRYGKKAVRVEYRDNGAVSKKDFTLSGLGTNSDFLTLLKDKQVETIHTQEATLEDIFIETTGRALV